MHKDPIYPSIKPQRPNFTLELLMAQLAMTACVTIFTIFVDDFEQLVTNESLSDLDVLLICSRSRLNEFNPKVAKSHHEWCFK